MRKDHKEDLKQGVTVMTDLDDTLICSGGSYLKGVDKVCDGTRAHETYPGAAAFYYALALAQRADVTWGQTAAVEAIPLSARPDGYKPMKSCEGPDLAMRQKICGCESVDACTAKKESCKCFGLNTEEALYGKWINITDHLKFWGRTYDRFGDRKVENWGKAHSGFGTNAAIFVGDNGQADRRAAVEMLQKSADLDDNSKGYILASFIHDVTNECPANAPCRKEWAEKSIFMFSTYSEAADIAEAQGFITANHANKVREAFTSEYRKPEPEPEEKPCPKWKPWCWR